MTKTTTKHRQKRTKEQEKQAERKKLGKTKVQTSDGEVEISKILPPPFGNAKDYSHKQADSAKEEVYDYYTKKFEEQELNKVEKRIGKNQYVLVKPQNSGLRVKQNESLPF